MDGNQRANCAAVIQSNEYADVLIDFLANLSDIPDFQNIRCMQTVSDRYAVIHTLNNPDLSKNLIRQGYYRAVPKLYGLMDTSNIENSGVIKLRRLPYLNLLGSGTIVGIIDTGIDYTNPLFKNADNTTRIRYLWDQSQEVTEPQEDVLYGRVYNSDTINEALASETPLERVPVTDPDGHGTFLAAIAAGNEDTENDFTGIAPLANLAVVKLKPAKQYLREFYGVSEDVIAYQENDIITGVRFLLTVAQRLSMPISILIGLGTNQGDHDGNSILSDYLNFVANYSGVCITTAAGNEGNAGHHFRGELPYNQSEEVEIKVGEQQKSMTVELWSQSPALFSVGLVSPSGEVAERELARANKSVTVTFVLEPTTVQVTYAVGTISAGSEVVLMQFRDLVPGLWKIRVYNDFNIGTTYDIWLPITNFLSADTYFLKPDPFITLVETGTTAKPISTATYNHKNNSIYINSSRGYTLSNQVKPDIVAPGVNVFGPVGNNNFGTKSGSSIAAAHTAGVSALLLQWGVADKNNLSMNTSQIKAMLIKGAVRTNQTYPNREWGYGILDAYNAFDSLRRTT